MPIGVERRAAVIICLCVVAGLFQDTSLAATNRTEYDFTGKDKR